MEEIFFPVQFSQFQTQIFAKLVHSFIEPSLFLMISWRVEKELRLVKVYTNILEQSLKWFTRLDNDIVEDKAVINKKRVINKMCILGHFYALDRSIRFNFLKHKRKDIHAYDEEVWGERIPLM